MKYLVTIASVICLLCACWFWGVFRGNATALRTVRQQALSDLKVAKQKGDAQLYEYLKARYYYYSNESRVRLRPGEGDFGPVKEELLNGYSAGKGLTTFKAEYDAYKRLPGFTNN